MAIHLPSSHETKVLDVGQTQNSGHTTDHYWNVLFQSKSIFRMLIIAALFIIINAVLLVVSKDKLPPQANAYGVPISLLSSKDATAKIQTSLALTRVEISNGKNTETFSFEDLGISANTSTAFQDINGTGIFTIPLINIARNTFTPPKTQFSYSINDIQLEKSLQPFIGKEAVTKPTNAKVSLFENEGVVRAITTADIPGEGLSIAVAKRQIQQQVSSPQNSTVTLRPAVINAEITEVDLQSEITEIEKLVSNPITVSNGTSSQEISTNDLRKFLITNNNPERTTGSIQFSSEKISSYLRTEIAPRLDTPAIPTQINLSGAVTEAGADGFEIDIAASTENLLTAINNRQPNVQLVANTVKPPSHNAGFYSKTNAGLNQLIKDFTKSHHGTYYVAVEQFTGGDLQAYHNAEKVIFPGSTYKLFLAYVLMYEIEKGEYTLDTPVPRGTVESCMFIMLHHSTNKCSRDFLQFVGPERVDEILANAGMEETRLNLSEVEFLETTTLDYMKLIRGLYDGTLLNEKHTTHILNILKGQKWRSGIPAGSPGSVVADKVGFWPGYENDGGIVYSPASDYGLVVMTEGGAGFGNIAALSYQIHQFLNR